MRAYASSVIVCTTNVADIHKIAPAMCSKRHMPSDLSVKHTTAVIPPSAESAIAANTTTGAARASPAIFVSSAKQQHQDGICPPKETTASHGTARAQALALFVHVKRRSERYWYFEARTGPHAPDASTASATLRVESETAATMRHVRRVRLDVIGDAGRRFNTTVDAASAWTSLAMPGGAVDAASVWVHRARAGEPAADSVFYILFFFLYSIVSRPLKYC